MASVNNRMNADTLSIDVLHTYILFYYKYCTNTFPRFLSSLLHLLYRSLKGVGDKWEAKRYLRKIAISKRKYKVFRVTRSEEIYSLIMNTSFWETYGKKG